MKGRIARSGGTLRWKTSVLLLALVLLNGIAATIGLVAVHRNDPIGAISADGGGFPWDIVLAGTAVASAAAAAAIAWILHARIFRVVRKVGDAIRVARRLHGGARGPGAQGADKGADKGTGGGDELEELESAFEALTDALRDAARETDRAMMRLNSESRAILNGFPHPVFIFDDRGALRQANPSAEALVEVLDTGRRIPLKIAKRLIGCLEQGEDYLPEQVDEAMLFRAGDRERWYLPRIFRIHDDEGDRFTGWAAVLIDVTRVRWLDDMKTDAIGTVSHEIKTPLTSIRMALHLLAEQKMGTLDEAQASLVGSARDDCERLLETLDNLLQLSRIESGQSSLQREPIEPAALVREAAESFAGYVREANLRVRTEIEERLPRVLADRPRIAQVFGNLLSNAVKHSPLGGEIVLRAAQRGGEFVRFTIVDHGPGVPESEQDRIFERFYRGAGENESGSDGTGLGLSIAREIVRAHGGAIGVTSRPGEPTEFHFDVPLSSR